MAITTTFSENFIVKLFSGAYDLSNDELKLALMNTSFSFDAETVNTWAGISSDEIAGANGYTTGGITLTSVVVSTTLTAGDGIVDITCLNNPSWTASGGAIATVGSAVLVDHTLATPEVILCIDFDADYGTPDGQMFQVNFSNGIAQATIAI